MNYILKRIILSLFLCTILSFSLSSQSKISDGILTLKYSDLERNETIKLSGNWEFYPLRFIKPGEFKSSDFSEARKYIKVPGFWNDVLKVDSLKAGFGFASYRLTIVFSDSVPEYLYMLENRYSSACDLYVNGKLISKSGKTSETQKGFVPKQNFGIVFFPALKSNEIVLHISNYSNLRGGLFNSPEIGLAENITRKYNNTNIKTIIIVSIIQIIVLLFIIFWIFNRNSKEYLYSGLLGISLIVRQLTIEQCLLQDIVSLPYNVYILLSFVSSYLSVAFFLLTFSKILFRDKLHLVVKVAVILAGIATVLTIILPNYYYKYFLLPYSIITIIGTFFILYKIIAITIEGKKNMFIFLQAVAVCVFAFIHDIFFHLEYISSLPISSWGILYMYINMTAALSLKMSSTIKKNIDLNKELNEFNKSLESKINEQTVEITNKNRILSLKADELIKINEELTKLHEFKENMTSMIVHDLKTPVNSLLLMANDKIKQANPDKTKKIANHLTSIIEYLNDIKMIENTQMKIHNKEFIFNDLILDAIDIVNPGAAIKNIKISFIYFQKLILNTDKTLLLRIICNLLNNAIKFSLLNSEIKIVQELEKKIVKLSIEDFGIGITSEERDKIFKKYYSNPKYQSTGLGLAFCKNVIVLLGGEIGYSSQPEKGSVFWVKIPIVKSIEEKYKKIEINPNLILILNLNY